jgi:hypothetical protein
MSETESKRRASQESRGRLSERDRSDKGSTRQSQRSTSSYGGTISDVETDYHKVAKKLAKDKEKLKIKLNNLLDDFEKKTDDHRRELEKSQDYYQEQLNELSEERDKSQDTIEEMRNSIIDEKEKIRLNFEQKLLRHKEAIEKRYGTKDSQVVKRLENTITGLQERLTQQIEERERSKENTEQYYCEREECLRKNISDLEEQLRKIKESCTKDRLELQKTAKTFNDEKDFMITSVKKQKDEEISAVIAERNAACLSVQNLKDQIEKRAKAADFNRDEEVAKMKFEVCESKRSFECKFNDANIAFKNSISEIKQVYEGKLYCLDQQAKASFELQAKENEKTIYNISGESSRKVEQVISETRNQIEEQKTIIMKLSRELETSSNSVDKKQEQLYLDLQCKYEFREREFKEISLKNDKIVGELNDTNTRLKEQFSIVKDNMKKLQDNSQNVSGQMMSTFAKQKEQLDRDIANRDVIIDKLERQVKKIGEEGIDRLNATERKLKNSTDDLKELVEKYITAKTLIDKKEKDSILQKEELSRIKESNDLYIEKLRKSLFEKELLETKAKTFEDLSKTKEASTETERNKAIQLHILSQNLQTKVKELEIEIERQNKASKNLQVDLETVSKNLTNTVTDSNRVRNQMSDELKKNISSIQLEKDKQIEDLKKSNSQTEHSYKIQLSHTAKEIENLRSQLAETVRKEISKISCEKDKQIEECKKTISTLENTVKMEARVKEQELDSLKIKLLENSRHESMKLSTEKDKQIEEYKNRISVIEKDINRHIEDSNKAMNVARDDGRKELQKTLSDKDKHTEELRKKISQMDNIIIMMQEQLRQKISENQSGTKAEREELSRLRNEMSKFYEQKEQFQTALQTGKTVLQEVLNKSNTEHSLELQKLNLKISETNIRVKAAEELADKTKAAYSLYLDNEGKKNGPEAKLRLGELEKERDSLLGQLASADRKIQQLQYDIASATATIRIKSQSLDEREASLRKTEEAIRTAPPKLLDPSIKKARDDAMVHLRQSKLELARVKEESLHLNQKLQIAENTVADLEKEKIVIVKSQAEIKETFVNNLNQQQDHHEKELQARNSRIKELETMLVEKMKALSH